MADPLPLQSDDNYQAYLSDKLWAMIPAIYRTLDTDSFNSNGPLREMVNRIGASAAVLRRSIDRLWEDQSIETCDDWVIAYIGDLLATNLVNSLDARGQRLDVANTVYYRQRKGTLAVLEEIAADITGWNARVVEFFRRMGRTRHNFDPPVGLAAAGPATATQLVATGDGTTIAFSHATLLHTPIYRGTVQAVVNGLAVGSDDGSGAIVANGDSGVSGTVDYGGGAVSLTFTTPPPANAGIQVTFNYLGFDTSLQIAEGLTGRRTGSQIGGWANLRNVYGAAKAQTAFDEFSHTADLRLGVDKVGWQSIAHLGVFVWRLYSFAAGITSPVASTACPGQYSFDPTGRMVPLFAATRNSSSYGDNWVSPEEWQLPGPISLALMQLALRNPQQFPLYATAANTPPYSVAANSVGVYTLPGSYYALLDPGSFLNAQQQTTIFPERGTFQIETPAGGSPTAPPLFVTYSYGFSSRIGAGPYARQLAGVPADATPGLTTMIGQGPPTSPPGPADIPDPSPTGTIAIQDSLTYTTISNFASVANVTVLAAAKTRPVLRWPAPGAGGPNEWTINGADTGSNLLLDGLLLSGADVVLTGSFASVTLRCCTLDPGNAAGGLADLNNTSGDLYAQSVDGRDLAPTRLWIEATINTLTLDRCIAGPVRTRNGGRVLTLAVNDSILQAIPGTDRTQPLQASDIQDFTDFYQVVGDSSPLSQYLRSKVTFTPPERDPASPPGWLNDLNEVIAAPLYTPALFAGTPLSPATRQLLAAPVSGGQLILLNRMLLEEAYPQALAQAAIALGDGETDLNRVTVLGRAFVHRMEASDCILDDFTVAGDAQHGCVRFTAWPAGSIVPRQYESVQITGESPIFTSREFGEPGYGQLLASADLAILSQSNGSSPQSGSSPAGGSSILRGAQDGSEMGAFAREKNPIKESSILIKYQEYMPLGLAPVLIRVT